MASHIGIDPEDELYKQAGALGVYSYYYHHNKDLFSKVNLKSPIRTGRRQGPPYTPPKSDSQIRTISRESTPISPIRQLYRMTPPTSITTGSATSASNTEQQLKQVNSTPLANPPNNLRVLSPCPEVHEKKISISTSGITKLPTNFDVSFNAIKQLAGKDKMGKVVQYTLRILLIYSSKLRSSQYLSKFTESAERINFGDVGPSKSYLDKLTKVLANLFNHPQFMLLFMLNQFESRFVGVVAGLSIYRQMLRAGTIPFRIIKLFKKLTESGKTLTNSKLNSSAKLAILKKEWINMITLDFLASLYYAWFDESLLYFKFGVLKKLELDKYYKFSVFHESFSWYLCILIELKQKYEQYQIVSNKEAELNLNYKVKERAKRLVSGLMSTPDTPDGKSVNGSIKESSKLVYEFQLKQLQKQKSSLQLDICKTLCDFAYDTVSVFNIKSCPDSLQLAFGLGAGVLSFYKVWDGEKEKLVKEINFKDE